MSAFAPDSCGAPVARLDERRGRTITPSRRRPGPVGHARGRVRRPEPRNVPNSRAHGSRPGAQPERPPSPMGVTEAAGRLRWTARVAHEGAGSSPPRRLPLRQRRCAGLEKACVAGTVQWSRACGDWHDLRVPTRVSVTRSRPDTAWSIWLGSRQSADSPQDGRNLQRFSPDSVAFAQVGRIQPATVNATHLWGVGSRPTRRPVRLAPRSCARLDRRSMNGHAERDIEDSDRMASRWSGVGQGVQVTRSWSVVTCSLACRALRSRPQHGIRAVSPSGAAWTTFGGFSTPATYSKPSAGDQPPDQQPPSRARAAMRGPSPCGLPRSRFQPRTQS